MQSYDWIGKNNEFNRRDLHKLLNVRVWAKAENHFILIRLTYFYLAPKKQKKEIERKH
jgi:hypothetical protein